jgi:hypothetical protein
VRAIRHRLRQLLPRRDGAEHVALLLTHVAEMEVRRRGARVDVDRMAEVFAAATSSASCACAFPTLVEQESENLLIARLRAAVDLGRSVSRTRSASDHCCWSS